MNSYLAFHKGVQKEVRADSIYEAQKLGAKAFSLKEKDFWRISVVLVEKNGEVVSHSTAEV